MGGGCVLECIILNDVPNILSTSLIYMMERGVRNTSQNSTLNCIGLH